MIGKDARREKDKQLSNIADRLAKFCFFMKYAQKLFRLPFHIRSTCKINTVSAARGVGTGYGQLTSSVNVSM